MRFAYPFLILVLLTGVAMAEPCGDPLVCAGLQADPAATPQDFGSCLYQCAASHPENPTFCVGLCVGTEVPNSQAGLGDPSYYQGPSFIERGGALLLEPPRCTLRHVQVDTFAVAIVAQIRRINGSAPVAATPPQGFELAVTGVATSATINGHSVSPQGGRVELPHFSGVSSATVTGPGGTTTCTAVAN